MSLIGGSLPPQRPDQQTPSTEAGVAPGASSGIVRARLVIVSGTGITGFFEYSGTPALGNPPVAYAAPPGVTQDPYGNTLPSSSGGFVASGALSFSAMASGAFFLALVGAIASAQDAAISISGSSAGQGISITSGVGPEAGGSPTVITITDSGAGGVVQVDAPDGNVYGVERLIQQVSPRSQSFSTVAGGNILGLSAKVVAGTYVVRASLIIEWNAAAGLPQMRFAGPTISQFDVSFASRQSGTSSTTNNGNTVSAGTGNGTGYNGNFINVTQVMTAAGVFFAVDVWGMFTFSASGTLTLQGASSVAGDAWLAFSGFWEVQPV